MSILLGLSNLAGALADTLEFGPVEAVRINTSFCPEAERAGRKLLKNMDQYFSEAGEHSLGKRMEEFPALLQEKIDRTEDDAHSEAYYGQLQKLACELHGCLCDFLEKAAEKYWEQEIFDERDELPEVDASVYGSGDYAYGRLSQAKVACGEALKRAVADMQRYFEEGKRQAEASGKKFLECMSVDIRQFLEEFGASYDDYVSLYCEEEARALAEQMKHKITDAAAAQCESLELPEKLDIIIREVFDEPAEKYWDVWEYFEQCDYMDDGGQYCFEMEEAVGSLSDTARDGYETACGQMEERLRELYQSVLDKLADAVSDGLVGLIGTDGRSI